MLQMPFKRKFKWQASYAFAFGLNITSCSGTNGTAVAVACGFC